jgi:hypothetical protein
VSAICLNCSIGTPLFTLYRATCNRYKFRSCMPSLLA